MKKNLLVLLLTLVMMFTLTACSENEFVYTTDKDNQEQTNIQNQTDIQNKDENASTKSYADIEHNPVVTMVIKDLGTIKMELYPQIAPETVENFISLANSGFYDGLIFHRVIPNFMVQGGDPDGYGTGGPDYSIKGEFAANGVENNISHVRGTLSMARSSDPDSAGSQFFIITTDSLYLDGQYAGFGKVIEGMEVSDAIVNSEVIRRSVDEDVDYYTNPEEYIRQSLECDRPVNPPVIEKVTVETFGVEYDEPEKLK